MPTSYQSFPTNGSWTNRQGKRLVARTLDPPDDRDNRGTGGDGMKYYMERTKLPEYNVVLDSKYPAVVAEKGTGALTVRFPMRVTDDNGIAVVALSAAAPANAI